MSMQVKHKQVLIITNIPNPYRIPLFNELNKQLLKLELRLKVIFGAMGYARRKWKIDMSECMFDYEVLPSRTISFGNSEKTTFTYKNLIHKINELNPFIIITIGFSFATMKIWLRSWFIHTPYIIWSGSIKRKGRSDSPFRMLQRRVLIKRAVGFIAYGTNAKNYFISLGAPDNKVHIAINTVDTQFYRDKAKEAQKRNIKKESKKHLLFIGHMTRGKRLDKLFHIVKCLSNKRDDFILELVGSGPEEKRLKKLAIELRIDKFIIFEGFKQKDDIPYYLGRGDCFLFPSEYDIWGLVLVEAMAAGLPCISSVYAGATRDLIKEGETGFVLDFSETEKVVEKIIWILDNEKSAYNIGLNASYFIEKNVSLQKSAAGFVKAVQSL